jgi:hypothetical protein
MKLRRSGLVEYLDRRLGSHFGDGPEYQWFCPFCIDHLGSESTKRKLNVNSKMRVGHCFRCGWKGGLEKLFRDMNGGFLLIEEFAILKREVKTVPPKQVKTTVREILFSKASPTTERKPVKLPREHIPLYEDLTARQKIMCRPAFVYMEKRGVSAEAVQALRLGYCPTGDYQRRLIFPVYQGGDLVYWTNRFCGKAYRKTKNPPNKEGHYTAQECLLNYDNALGARLVALVEGPFDVLAYWYNGIPALGLIGKRLSERQVALLTRLAEHGTREFVISLDSDASRESAEYYNLLLGRVPKVSALLLTHGDPDERREELRDLLQSRGEPSVTSIIKARFNR